MRDRETIDSELRLLAAVDPSSRRIDELLDERLGHLVEDAPAVTADDWPQRTKPNTVVTQRRRGVLQRFGILAALPLSLLAAGAVLAMTFAVPDPHPAAQPAEAPPSAEPTHPAAPRPPAPPVDHVAPPQLVDRAFVDALKQEGVPVPSPDYVLAQGHGVCDFLSRQPDFAAATRFVQQQSIWDADQSSNVAAGAIVSYCPQYQAASMHPEIPDQLEKTFQKAQSDLQAINGALQDIRDDLPDHGP